jgi:transcriptional regulator with XRE-family HTH domain
LAKRGIIRYSGYYFSDQDPIVGYILALKREKKLTNSKLSAKTKVATSTYGNWESKKTKQPRFATLAASAVALGLTSLPLTPEGRRNGGNGG